MSTPINIAVGDTLSFRDSPTYRVGPSVLTVGINDFFQFTDFLNVSASLRIQPSDSISFLDSLTPTLPNQKSLSDTFSFSDAVSVTLSSPMSGESVSDTLSFSDSVSISLGVAFDASYIRRYLNDVKGPSNP